VSPHAVYLDPRTPKLIATFARESDHDSMHIGDEVNAFGP
jgi:hypothetical protein